MIVLDTHIWLRWINQSDPLKPLWRSLIESDDTIGVSAISCFEVAWLAQHKRIALTVPLAEWFEKALAGSDIEMLPITTSIACRAVALPEHHSNPQDRLIIATAIEHSARLISADSKFPMYQELIGCLIQ